MANKKKSYLIVISAPSGAGKTTLGRKLLQDFAHLEPSISSTTRAARGTEKDGVDYFFLNVADFETEVHEERFAEWAKVHGHYYGTSKAVIENAFRKGKSVLLVIDVQGARQIRQTYKDESLSIFIAPPSMSVLESRLRARGTDTEEIIQKRLANALTEMAESSLFDAVIVNDSLDTAYAQLKNLVKERLHLRLKTKARS